MAEKVVKKATKGKATKEKTTKTKKTEPKVAKGKKSDVKITTKTKSKATKKSKTKSTKSKKASEDSFGDMGIVIVEDDLTIDQEKINEERRAYLEEARSQEAFD